MPDETAPAVPNPPLRITRRWHWVPVEGLELRIGGGPPPLRLQAADTLEVFHEGAWQPLPVHEEPRPEHPRDAERRKHVAAMERLFEEQQASADGRTHAPGKPGTFLRTRKG